jgi:hypothetical protein
MVQRRDLHEIWSRGSNQVHGQIFFWVSHSGILELNRPCGSDVVLNAIKPNGSLQRDLWASAISHLTGTKKNMQRSLHALVAAVMRDWDQPF